jgi:cytochrome c oxidase cbb3-type subunit 3
MPTVEKTFFARAIHWEPKRLFWLTAGALLAIAASALAVSARPQADNSVAGSPRLDESVRLALERELAAGRSLFEQRCALCHGMDGSGGRGPNLQRTVLEHASNLAEIASVIKNGIAPDMPEGWYFSDQDLANLATYVRSIGQTPQAPLPGDPARGKRVFEQSGCLSCHILDGRGNSYGPDLSDVGSIRGPNRLRQTLIDPKSSITPGFLLVAALTARGETIRGIRRNEDTLTIQIQDATGQFHSLVKSELRSFTRLHDETPMPSFAGVLSKQQLDDLASYLAVQRLVR